MATLAATLLAVPTPACALLNAYSVKYGLEITLLVDGKPMTRSTVVRVTWRDNSSPITEPGYVSKVCGAGLLFDFGDKGALLTPIDPISKGPKALNASFEEIAITAIGKLPGLPYYHTVSGGAVKPYLRAAQQFKGSVTLLPPVLPQFIWVPREPNVDRVRGLSALELAEIDDPKVVFSSARAYSTSSSVKRHIEPPDWLALLMGQKLTVPSFANRAGNGPGIERSRFEEDTGEC